MPSLRRLRVPSILLIALVAALAFAGNASAETLSGEATAPPGPGTNPEAEIISAKASYDSASGTMSATIIAAAEAEEEVGGSPSELSVQATFVHATGSCDPNAVMETGGVSFPAFGIVGHYSSGESEALEFSTASTVVPLGPATMTVSGNATNLSGAYPQAVNQGLNCAFVFLGSGPESQSLVFALNGPPAVPVVIPPTPPAPTAAFSLAKIKTLKAKEGKWTKVNVKVTNTGGAAAGPIAIKAKAPKGVVLQPASGSLKLPALLAGQSWTVTFKAKLTSKAKKSSKIALTTSSGAISATGSFLIKLVG